jgi:hypothetical protein
MEELDGGVWAARLLIPDNPETPSKKKFEYHSKLDALTYAWELTTETVEVANAIVDSLPGTERF